MTGHTISLEAQTQAVELGACRRFLRFASSSLIATLIDQTLAWELFALLDQAMPEADFTRILIASVVARLVSLTVNFSINSRLVFGGLETDAKRRTFARFLTVAGLILLLSCIGVWLAHTLLDAPEWQAKIVCDLCLFFLNYALQRTWVFADEQQTGRHFANERL